MRRNEGRGEKETEEGTGGEMYAVLQKSLENALT